MQEQIFKSESIYGSKIEIRVTGNVVLIAVDDKDDCIITTDLINCKDHWAALAWAEKLCKTAANSGILINDKIY